MNLRKFYDWYKSNDSGHHDPVPCVDAVRYLQRGLPEYRRLCRFGRWRKRSGRRAYAAIMFLVACGLAFSTGTSWGTFGILIPIAFAVVGAENMNALTISTSAILAGAVCGDHVSPISDTTILASAGAQCDHINHVSTQIPYVLCVAGCCVIGYLAAGITQNGWIGTLTGLLVLAVVLVILDRKNNPKFAARR